MRIKTINPQVFLEFLCYCLFGGLMLYLIYSGKYLSYITPRMKPYLYFTAIIMLLWALVSVFRIFRPQHKVRSAHCFVLVIPALFLLLPHNSLSVTDFTGNYIGGNTYLGQSTQTQPGTSGNKPPDDTGNPITNIIESNPLNTIEDDIPLEDTEPIDSDTTIPDTQTNMQDEYDSSDLPGLDMENKKITIYDDDFGMWLSELYMDMDKYEGYTVVMTGFVFKDTEVLNENEFVPARLMMTCCVADLSPAGLVCTYDKVSELEKDSWVTIEGTLVIGEFEYDGQTYNDPQIAVTKVTLTDEVEGYVYPY
jgi:putative membrane protein